MPILMIGSGAVSLTARLPIVISNRVSVVKISGITKDSTGAPLSGVTVELYKTFEDVIVGTTISDALGVYSFDVVNWAGAFYAVAYKAGSPDVAGTTVNTLLGA